MFTQVLSSLQFYSLSDSHILKHIWLG